MADAPTGDFFQGKHGGIPMWAWIAIGVVGLFVVSKLRSGGSSATSTQPNPAPTVYAVANSPITNPVTRGTDMLYGSGELAYMQQNIGKGNITAENLNKVQAKYNEISNAQGVMVAEQYHYHLNPDGTISTMAPGTFDPTKWKTPW